MVVFASVGNMDESDHWSYVETGGWVNWLPTSGGATVTLDFLYGFIWMENAGWVNLGNGKPDNGFQYSNTGSDFGVNREDGTGKLSGYAWSETCGWINFNPSGDGVYIHPDTGEFNGNAWCENLGWMIVYNNSPAFMAKTSFLQTPTPTPTPSPTPPDNINYDVIDLGTLGGRDSQAMAINNRGQIVGFSTLPGNETTHAFLYIRDESSSPTGMIDLGTLGGDDSWAYNINKAGHIVGDAYTKEGFTHGFYLNAIGNNMEDLGTLGRMSSQARGINDNDVVVGYISSIVGGGALYTSQPSEFGFLWWDGVMKDLQLSTLSNGAQDINNSGAIVGWVGDVSPNAIVYQDDVITTISVEGGGSGSATAINQLGHVTGALSFPDTQPHAFLYKEDWVSDLGTLGGNYSEGFDVNIDNVVVGSSGMIYPEPNHALVFFPENWITYDLNRLIPPNSGWILQCAHGINDSGEIVGYGSVGGNTHAFLLEPVYRPHLVGAVFNDTNRNNIAEPGETLTLVFDQGVTITQSLITPDCFYLPVLLDNLGSSGFKASINPYTPRELILTLGQGAFLTIEGNFSPKVNQSGSPSGIDLSVARPQLAIRSFDGSVDSIDLGEQYLDDTGLDIKYSFRSVVKNIGAAGGTLDNSGDPDATYHHSLYIPAGSISSPSGKGKAEPDVQFTMQSPDIPLPPPGCVTPPPPEGAIQILANQDNVPFSPPATLTLEYLEGDVDIERGFAEAGMRINMLLKGNDGCWHWVPISGEQIVDTENHTVTVYLGNLTGATGEMRLLSPGDSGIFGNLPGSTIEESTINIKPQGGGMVRILSGPTLNAGGGGCYTYHQIEFPNYVETDPSDPNVIKVTIKQATLADRIARSGGNSFPTASNALFVVWTKNYSNVGVPFNSPVNIRVQFMDGSANSFNDVWYFDNTAGEFSYMAIVKDTIEGTGVDFQFIQGVAEPITPVTGGGYVEGTGITGLTDSQGKGVWGVVSKPLQPTNSWMVY